MVEGRDAVGWEPATLRDVLSAVAFAAVLSPFAYRALTAIVAGEDLVTLVAAVLLGFLAADLATGSVHWLCDTFFAEDTPIIGPSVIESFREHHVDPLAMTRRAFLRVSNSNIVATTVLLTILLCVQSASSSTPSAFSDVWVTSFTFAVMATNQFHKWAHLPRVPSLVARLQRLGLILSPVEHARHHTGDHSRAFCVTTGWCNPLLDRFRVFAACERLVGLLRRRWVPRRSNS
jgi:ubiquitin-conjugating enzyme E2 variant